MKKIIFTLTALFFLSASFAQILNPVKFNYSAVKKGDKLYEVHIKTLLEPKWHIYSVKNPKGGAEPTTIKVKEGKGVGVIKEKGTLKTVFDKEFQLTQNYYENTVDFVQIVKVNSATKNITGNIVYMVCNDKQCLPPKDVEFKIKL
ncbi:MAG: protein-disulfide reductase DsbD domain-containing protein [Ginsengibacter sp.]